MIQPRQPESRLWRRSHDGDNKWAMLDREIRNVMSSCETGPNELLSPRSRHACLFPRSHAGDLYLTIFSLQNAITNLCDHGVTIKYECSYLEMVPQENVWVRGAAVRRRINGEANVCLWAWKSHRPEVVMASVTTNRSLTATVCQAKTGQFPTIFL